MWSDDLRKEEMDATSLGPSETVHMLMMMTVLYFLKSRFWSPKQ